MSINPSLIKYYFDYLDENLEKKDNQMSTEKYNKLITIYRRLYTIKNHIFPPIAISSL